MATAGTSAGKPISMYYVYILLGKHSFHYTGITDNLSKRIKEHNFGNSIATKAYRPLRVVWYCAFSDRPSAARFEKYLKTGSGRAFTRRHFL